MRTNGYGFKLLCYCVRLQKAVFHLEFQAIAQLVVGHDLDAFGQPGKQTLGREGDKDLPLPARESVTALEDRVVPPAVQSLVAVARKLRTGILRKGSVRNLERCSQSDLVHNPSVYRSRAYHAV